MRKRKPQRSWKEHRKTKYHRLTGWSNQQVRKWFKMMTELHQEQAQRRQITPSKCGS